MNRYEVNIVNSDRGIMKSIAEYGLFTSEFFQRECRDLLP